MQMRQARLGNGSMKRMCVCPPLQVGDWLALCRLWDLVGTSLRNLALTAEGMHGLCSKRRMPCNAMPCTPSCVAQPSPAWHDRDVSSPAKSPSSRNDIVGAGLCMPVNPLLVWCSPSQGLEGVHMLPSHFLLPWHHVRQTRPIGGNGLCVFLHLCSSDYRSGNDTRKVTIA